MEGNKEKKMRSVELTVWTGDLGMIDITPVSKKYANKYIGSGEDPDDVYEQFEDTCSIYFVNGNEHVNLKVKDGDKELSYDNLPQLDFGVADDYRDYTLQEFLEDIWDGDDDNKPQSEEDIIKYLDDNFDDDDDSWPAWKVLHNANLDEAPGVFCKLWEEFEEGGYIDFVNYIRLQAQEYNEAFSDDGINFYACGSVGKGQVNFYIELPEDEEFDIKKLHFPCSCDWWDDDFGLSDECFNVFRGMDVLLEVVEYDGRFYRMTDPYFVPGWKDFGGAKFLDCELEELEYDEELDDEDLDDEDMDDEEMDDEDEEKYEIDANGVAQIPEDATEIPDDAFELNEDLRSITIPDSITNIGDSAFRGCSNLENLTFGNRVESIGDLAFAYCKSLKDIVLPNSLERIGFQAFDGCSSLSTITLGANIKYIDDLAFDSESTSLKAIYVPSGKADYYKELLDDETLANLVQELPE